MFEWRRSGPRLKVMATALTTFSPLGSQSYVAIDVTNIGRLSKVVQPVGFRLPSGSVLISPEPAVPTTRLPRTRAPSANFTYPLDAGSVLEEMRKHGYSVSDLTPYANSGHGMTTGRFDDSGKSLLRSAR
jgi:hypothetical protein